jgi:hypothetical protein
LKIISEVIMQDVSHGSRLLSGRSGSQVDRWSLGDFNDRQLNAYLGAAFVALFSLDVMEDSYKSKLAEALPSFIW